MSNLIEKLANLPMVINKAQEATSAIKKAPSALKARALEFLAGGAVGAPVGGTVGYKGTKDEKNKKKNALKGALIGGLAGGAGAVGLNRLALNRLKATDANISKEYSNINSRFSKEKEKAQDFYNKHTDFSKGDTGTEKYYDDIYKKREKGREAGASEIKNQVAKKKERAKQDFDYWKNERREKILNHLKTYKEQKAKGFDEAAKMTRRDYIRNKPYGFYGKKISEARKRMKDSDKFKMHDPELSDYKTMQPGWNVKSKIKSSRIGNINDIFENMFDTKAEERIANKFTNKENLRRFKDKYIDNHGIKDIVHDSSIHDKQKSRFFGGFRGKKDIESARAKGEKHLKNIKNYGDDIDEKNMKSSVGSMFDGMMGRTGGKGESSSFLGGKGFVTPEEMKKTKEYQDHLFNIRKNVAKDIRKGKKGDFFEGYQKAQDRATKSSFSDEDKAKFGDLFGKSFDSVKSKKDYQKIFRNTAKKYHPDTYKGPDKMTHINEMHEKFKNSDHYDKLAMIELYKDQIEKKAWRY
jgi:hypothetical protein